MQILPKKEICCGCSACFSICNQKAIFMVPNNEGFRYPKIDTTKCIKCGMCKQVCPVLKIPESFGNEDNTVFAAKARDNNLRLKSSSGGVFSLLANYILKSNGIVVGAAFSEDYRKVSHIMIDSPKQLDRLRGSKYVQSDIGSVYASVKRLLEEKKKVLFSGTGCQIAGLRNYLKKKYDNLYLIDVVCHGVPSPKLWSEYLEQIEKVFHEKAMQISFRFKVSGWEQFGMEVKSDKHYYFRELSDDPYLCAFQKNLNLRESCYCCKLKSSAGISDISLGDLWGASEIVPDFYDNKGISFVYIHSNKGQELLECIAKDIQLVPIDIKAAIAQNPNIAVSAKRPDGRTYFYVDLMNSSLKKTLKKYTKKSKKDKIRGFIEKIGLLPLAYRILRKKNIGGGYDENLKYGLYIQFYEKFKIKC